MAATTMSGRVPTRRRLERSRGSFVGDWRRVAGRSGVVPLAPDSRRPSAPFWVGGENRKRRRKKRCGWRKKSPHFAYNGWNWWRGSLCESEKLVSMLKKQKESNRPYGAIGASPPLVLEPHALLKGKKATAFPALCDKLSDRSEIENRLVVDGNLITSRGPGTSMEFALAIVENFY